MSPDSPYFRLSTFGHAGSTHVSLTSLLPWSWMVTSLLLYNYFIRTSKSPNNLTSANNCIQGGKIYEKCLKLINLSPG